MDKKTENEIIKIMKDFKDQINDRLDRIDEKLDAITGTNTNTKKVKAVS